MNDHIEYYAKTDADRENVRLFKKIAAKHSLTLHHANKALAPWHLYTVIGEKWGLYPQRIDFWPHKLKAMNAGHGGRVVCGYGEIERLILDAYGLVDG